LEPQPHPNASGRELELELIRVRAEAAAARLEARAAELELMLLAQRQQPRLDAAPSMQPNGQVFNGQVFNGQAAFALPVHGSFASGHEDAAESLIFAIRRLIEQGSGGAGFPMQFAGAESFPAAVRNTSGWESRLSGLRGRGAEPSVGITQRQSNATQLEQFSDRIAMASKSEAEASPEIAGVVEVPLQDVAAAAKSETAAEDVEETRVDAASEAVKRPRMLDRAAAERSADSARPADDVERTKNLASGKKVAAAMHVPERRAVAVPTGLDVGQRPAMKPIPVSIAEDSTSDDKPKRRRPAGWLISTTAHVVGLLALGLFTLANPKPKDQLAFTASVSEASEETVESFTIEAAEQMPEVAEPTPTETAADVSPLGTLQMAEVSLDLPTAVTPPMTSAMSGETTSELMKLAKSSVKGDTLSKVQFAGLDGGGNHFVYLVDSSNSMKKFNDARTELLRSIDSLKPDQRFYVVFYDENPKFMRIASPSRDEPASIYATPESKQTFRRWAMAVQQARGQSPPEVLKFAFKLRPDVIFLLSDGEFTAQTETVIRENNLQENLFGESGPISIIHTIRYPGVSTTEGRQAEVQMQRIAAENGGQYRNVEIK